MVPDTGHSQSPISASGDEVSVDLSSRFRDEVVELLGSVDLSYCFQCGVCSGSCPTISHMEYGPRKILHMIHLGLTERVLTSPDIWYCVSCYMCAARCPQAIEITDVMGALRNMAVARGLTDDKEATFSKIFLQVLREHGHMYEPELLIRYYASVLDVESMVKIAPLGIQMFLKNKIGLLPERVKHPKELANIITQAGGRNDS